MSGSVIPNPVFTPLDNSGLVVVGGKLYSYAAGTSTPQNTYTSSTLGTANANPVIMDSAGRATIFLDPTLGYKFIFKTAADVTLWTVDNVALPIASGSITLAMMANLAQDKFIGRVTASTGVPETATITAAARTVLDDTTVGAMVDTIGGATAIGTGGLARANAPAFTAVPTFTPGSGTDPATVSGVINVNTTQVGNIGAGEDTLISYTMPANTLATNGRGVRIRAWGLFANNANNKYLIMYFGTYAIIQSALVPYTNKYWVIDAVVIRTGAATQISQSTFIPRIPGVTATEDVYVECLTPTETLSAGVTIKCTGQSSAGATDDVIQYGMIVEVI